MKYRLFILFLFTTSLAYWQPVQAQLSRANETALSAAQDTLKDFTVTMVMGQNGGERFHANDSFVRGLVKALKTPYSFYYPFDSLNVSKLYAPDSSFRIFTWQLKKDEYVYHQWGAIQMNTSDGSLKLFPLHDVSMFSAHPDDSVRTNRNWIGAIYYRIVLKEFNGKKYYTLLGFDDFAIDANKKWMEVLTFNSKGEPVFGGPYISFKNDTIPHPVEPRFSLEYKKEATTTFNYDPNLDLIVYDHLMSETEEPNRKSTYVPDGSYEAFKWEDGQWVHQYTVFDYKLEDGQFPVDATILDKDGNIDEKKLEEASRRNMEKGENSSTPPANKKDPPKEKSKKKGQPSSTEDLRKIENYF